MVCLHFSPQICSLPPPQPQLSTASQAPRTSSPLPAQVSSSAGSQYVHTTANPEPWQASLSASSPMGRPADHDGLVAQPVAAGLPTHCSPLPAAPFQRLLSSQLFPAFARPLTHVPVILPGPSASWSLRQSSPAEADGVAGEVSQGRCCWLPGISMAVLLCGRERSAEHSCPLVHGREVGKYMEGASFPHPKIW